MNYQTIHLLAEELLRLSSVNGDREYLRDRQIEHVVAELLEAATDNVFQYPYGLPLSGAISLLDEYASTYWDRRNKPVPQED